MEFNIGSNPIYSACSNLYANLSEWLEPFVQPFSILIPLLFLPGHNDTFRSPKVNLNFSLVFVCTLES